MSSLQEIESAISQLSTEERAELRNWLESSEVMQHSAERQQELSQLLDEQTKKLAAVQQLLLQYSAIQSTRVAARDSEDLGADAPPLSTSNQLLTPVVLPSKYRDSKEWLQAFQAWVDSHSDVTAMADDSRESIYAGRGE